MTILTKDEWRRRYAARMQERLGAEWTAQQCAELAEAVDDDDMDGGYSPEDAADEELSYWTNDGE